MARSVVLVLALVTLSLAAPAVVSAQDGGLALDALGLPELRLSVSETGIDVPSEAAAGRNLVVLDNPSPYDVEVTLFLPPAGLTADRLQATPDSDEGEPGWFYDAVTAGGVSAEPGGTDRAVVDLAPAGDWVVEVGRYPNDDAATTPVDFRESSFMPLLVAGDAPAAADVAAGVTVEMRDDAFAIADRVAGGPQLWAVTNVGQEPHHVVLTRPTVPVTDALVAEWLSFEFGMAPADATPSPNLPTFDAFADVAYVPVLSAGRTTWVALDLEPGTYVAFCFVSDRETGMPHAAMGMVEVFTVAAPGTPTA